MRPARIHNLRGNKAERSPHRLLLWDTETTWDGDQQRQLHQLRCWAACVVQRHGRRPTQPARADAWGSDPEQLADYVQDACRSSETTWAFAHNQGFDLAVTRLPLRLIERGWTITAHALATASPWARLSKGGHRLVLADSSSLLPGPLAAAGVAVGLSKPELPDGADDLELWRHRCAADVAILAAAITELMDWWDRGRRGAWSITGPQSGFNLMRHVPGPHTVVIDPDPHARAFERSAILAGRREVWRLGRQEWGDYREIDFVRAHATIAAHCPLPKRRSVHFDRLPLDDWRLVSDRWAPLAECSLNVRVPRYPLVHAGRLWYPLGRFRTVLCGPEIKEALSRGELLEVGPGYIYQLGQHMGHWGRWINTELDTPDPDTPEVARSAIKAWSRQVPGKWAARTGRELHSGVSPERGWHLEHGRHHPSGAPVSVLDMAGRREVVLQDQDADDCFPAVLAWIQSEVRVRLGRLIDAIGPDHMLSCNTDGVLCNAAGWTAPDTLQDALEPLRAREKARHAWVDVISPQHVILPTERRLSGVPASATEVAPRQYRWLTWPRLATQIAEGDPAGYVRQARAVDLRSVPVNRWVTSSGRAMPIIAELGEDGVTHLLPSWSELDGTLSLDLRTAQHPVLQQLLQPAPE